MKTKKNKAGFTLVELMVVAIIVAILAAVTIPLMSGNKERAAATEGQAGCSTIATALRMVRAQEGQYEYTGTSVTNLPGINAGDLNGNYFGEGNYAITITDSGGGFEVLATAADRGGSGISGTVGMVVSTEGIAAWWGTLLGKDTKVTPPSP